MIEIYNSQGNPIKHFFQWDRNIQILYKNNSGKSVSQIHFSNLKSDTAMILLPFEDEQKVNVPNILLTNIHSVIIHFCHTEEDGSFETLCEFVIPVKSRQKPSDYIYTETEILDYKFLEDRINEIQATIGDINQIIDQINGEVI